MLYLIVYGDGCVGKSAVLTEDMLNDFERGYINIIRPQVFGDEVVSYEYLHSDGAWERIK